MGVGWTIKCHEQPNIALTGWWTSAAVGTESNKSNTPPMPDPIIILIVACVFYVVLGCALTLGARIDEAAQKRWREELRKEREE